MQHPSPWPLLLALILCAPSLGAEWTVVNEGEVPVTVTYRSWSGFGVGTVLPGESLTLDLPAEVYELLFEPEGSLRRSRQRIDLRETPSLRTVFPFQASERRPRTWAAGQQLRPGIDHPPVAAGRPAVDPWRPRRIHLSLDLFAGATFTAKGEIERVVETDDFTGDESTLASLDAPATSAPVFGVRAGLGVVIGQRHGLSLGGAFEYSRFSASGDLVSRHDVDAISLLFLPKLLINRSEECPGGRFQVYGGVGLGIYLSKLELDQVPGGPGMLDARSTDVGFEARLGVGMNLIGPLGVFCEYRFSLFKARVDVGDASGPLGGDEFIDRPVLANHLLAGLTLSY